MGVVQKTIMGVIPSRETVKIQHLNVLMEGKATGTEYPAVKHHHRVLLHATYFSYLP